MAWRQTQIQVNMRSFFFLQSAHTRWAQHPFAAGLPRLHHLFVFSFVLSFLALVSFLLRRHEQRLGVFSALRAHTGRPGGCKLYY